MIRKKILYITFDGILQPLGKSQIIPYLKKLSYDYEIHILSFERKIKINEKKEFYNYLNEKKIKWNIFHIDKFKLNNLIKLIFLLIKLPIYVFYKKIDIIHCRSYIPGIFGLYLKTITNTKYIFDIRGFWPDEKLEGNYWKKDSYKYKFFKFIEKYIFIYSNCIITLTKNSREKIFQINKSIHKNINVIPTCVDINEYKISNKIIDKNLIKLCYLGSIGGWYNFSKCIEFCNLINSKFKIELIIINDNQHDEIEDMIKNKKISFNYSINKVSHDKINLKLNDVDFGIFFIDPKPSKIASCPTKMGEFLSKGIFCISNDGIGDTKEILNYNNSGLSLPNLDNDTLKKYAQKLIKIIENNEINKQLIRETASKFLNLDNAVVKIKEIYGKT